ncbi:MAG TPA: ABC transporter permease [Gemmatimonadaceae bacterium]|nr:ABC transporter permease [Gemmatimonadaceae bacterium]
METLVQDVRYALRGLRRSPAFTMVALLTLALGIGVNASIFSVVNAILFRPLPVERPAELVDIYGHSATSNTHDTHSYPNYLDYRANTKTLSGLTAYSNFFANLSIQGSSEIVIGELVTDNYFSTLGVRPILGRAFVPDEYVAQGASPVAVISYRFWQSRFAGDPRVLGRTFRLNGITYSIVGVAPADFGGMVPAATAQMWIPTTMVEHVEPMGNQRTSGKSPEATRLEQRGRHWMWMKGRLRSGADVAQVRTEFDGMARQLGATYPATNAQERISVIPSKDVRINPDVDGVLLGAGLVMVAAVGLVLIVACANLANLTLARAAGRRREVAVRLALGAARGRMVRQLLTESVVLALAGGAVALPLAAGLARWIANIEYPLPIDIGLEIAPDWRVLVYTFAAAVLTGAVFGLIPALQASRPDLVPALKQAGSWSARRRKVELRDALVVVQMAVSLVLVVVGALLVRSLNVASKVDLGFDGEHAAVLAMALEMNGYNRERGGQFFETVRQRLEGLPQVRSVSLTTRSPLALNNNTFSVFIDGHQRSAEDKPFDTEGAYVDQRYAETLGLQVLSGRFLETADRTEGRRVAVITKAMAQKYWPGLDAVGKEFRTRWGDAPYVIVGVVSDYKTVTPGESPRPYIHLPFGTKESYAEVVVRTTPPAHGLVQPLERELRALDPNLVFLKTGTLREAADVRIFPVKAGAVLIGAFGLLALVVAAVGLYGVIAYSVSRRVREIGIRKALGARGGMLVGMVLGEGMRLVAIGGVVGAVLAALGARVLSSALFVQPFDVASFGLAFGVLAAVALVANVVPARRAARVDPVIALRQE